MVARSTELTTSSPFPIGFCNWALLKNVEIWESHGIYGELPECLLQLEALESVYVCFFRFWLHTCESAVDACIIVEIYRTQTYLEPSRKD